MSHTATLIPPQAPPPVPPRPFTVARFFGNAFMGVWLALTVGVFLMMAGGWDPQKITRYGPGYLSGLGVTLLLVGLSVVLGGLLSLPLAFARMSKNRIFSGFAYVYVYFFRGTPLLTQLFLVYYGLGSFSAELKAMGLWWFFRDAWNCALLTFTLNTAAYQAEILRGAIESVPRGQHEGAAALGLPRSVAFLKVILPQALIVALRPYGNEIILMIKGSAIVAMITVYDLMGETRRAYSRTFDFQTYIWAALIYLAIVETLRNAIDWIERRITRHLRR